MNTAMNYKLWSTRFHIVRYSSWSAGATTRTFPNRALSVGCFTWFRISLASNGAWDLNQLLMKFKWWTLGSLSLSRFIPNQNVTGECANLRTHFRVRFRTFGGHFGTPMKNVTPVTRLRVVSSLSLVFSWLFGKQHSVRPLVVPARCFKAFEWPSEYKLSFLSSDL